MTTVTERKTGLWCPRERRKSLFGGLAIGFEPLARFKRSSCDLPRRLSAGFGLRLAPSKTQQKSRRQPSDSSWRQLATAPPTRKVFALRFGQPTQGPQEPESCRHQFNPDLNAPFSFSTVELSAGQSQIAFHKSDAVFNTEALFINRLGLARRRQFSVRGGGHEEQPQRTFITRLPVGLVLNHTIEHELLRWPLAHPHVIPTADLDPTAIFKLPFLFGVNLWQRSRVIEFDLSPAHWRTPETRIRRWRQEENPIASHPSKHWNAQLVNRIEKRFNRVLCIHSQHLLLRPTLSLDELIELRDPVSNRIGFRWDPADLQWQCPTSLADTFREQRQAMAELHPRSAMHIAQLDGLSLWSRIIARIQNPHAPFARSRIERNAPLRSEPGKTLPAQLLQPVIIRDRLSQRLARAINPRVKAAPLIAPQGTECQFDRRGWAWPGCQDINYIDQDHARWPKALRDVVTKIFYTRLRGAVCFFHDASNIALDARLGGGLSSPFFD